MRFGSRPAVRSADQELSFRALDQRANQLAHHLRRLGVGRDDRVAVLLPRSPRMVVAVLAILKSGAAYVPVDPSYPRERVAYLLGDSRPRLALCAAELAELTGELPALVLEPGWWDACTEPTTRPPPVNAPEDLAYVIYTSGSTGRPKGVAMPHRALSTLVGHQLAASRPGLRTLQYSALSFDVSFQEMFSTWCSGGTLVLTTEATRRDPAALLAQLAEERIERLFLPFVALQQLAEAAREPAATGTSLQEVITAGEQLMSTAAIRRWFARCPGREAPILVNQYGPSETHVVTAHALAPAPSLWSELPPIGNGIDGVVLRVLDHELHTVAPGSPGELFVGGTALARGYLDRPGLTAARFVPDPLGKGGRLYRTGDRVRWREDGSLEFLGRADDQVKVRGYRVELGEVEAALARASGVAAAAATVRGQGGGKQLLGYVVLRPGGELDAIRAALRRELPEYMVPSALVTLPALPLSPSGKVDRKALPAPSADAFEREAYVAPRTEIERALAAIWSELLGLEQIGANDDFFALGGHSLSAMRVLARVRTQLGAELSLRDIFAASTVAGLARAIADSGQQALRPPLLRAERRGRVPLSHAQAQLYTVARMSSRAELYNVAVQLRVDGRLEPARLERALQRLVQRHEALRTSIGEDAAGPHQVIAPALAIALPQSEVDSDAELERVAAAAASAPFDLERGPLFRAHLARGPNGDVLVLAMHHIVSDGWSLDLICTELAAFYDDDNAALPAPGVQYADYAIWQRQWLSEDALAPSLRRWCERLDGAPPLLTLPWDRPRPSAQRYAGASLSRRLPSDLSDQLRNLARRKGLSLYQLGFGLYALLLSRYSGQDDVVIGTVSANRSLGEVEATVGYFVTPLPVRISLAGSPSVPEVLARTRAAVLDALGDAQAPLEAIVAALEPERSPSHAPLFQVLYSLEQEPNAAPSIGGLRAEKRELSLGTAKFDLSLVVGDHGDGLELSFEYDTDLFEAATIERMAGAFERLARHLVAEGHGVAADLSLLSAEDERHLVEDWNAPTLHIADPRPVPHLVADRAAESPKALAVADPQLSLSFGELERRANRIAHELVARGVRRGDRVALWAERSAATIAAIYGITKAGAAYLPVDASIPLARLEQIVRDAGVRVCFAAAADSAAVSRLVDEVVPLDAVPERPDTAPAVQLSPDDLAYVIYTSGSTGSPKGVELMHVGLRNAVAYRQQLGGLAAGDRHSFFNALGFDVSTLDLWSALATGASLHIAAEDTRLAPERLRDWIVAERLTVVHAPTPLAELLISLPWPEDCRVRCFFTSGDRLRQRPWPSHPFTFVNAYGPTECSIEVTACVVPPVAPDETSRPPSIGRPVANATIYIVDDCMQPVPVGVVGELYIGGESVGRGYLGQPALTAERFVPDPFSSVPGRRLYRTGDLCRYGRDGSIDFLGRRDHQVKVRGFRIELGEIEAVLSQHDHVSEVVVVPRHERLVAYVVAGSGAPTAEALREHVGALLPPYMVPAAFVVLESLPRTNSGKIDRKALPEPGPVQQRMAMEARPETEAELALHDIWCDLLELDSIGIDTDFFESGGHSILMVRMLSRLRELAGVELGAADVFAAPTIRRLAAVMSQHGSDETRPPLLPRADQIERLPLSYAQEQILAATVVTESPASYHTVTELRFDGRLDAERLERALEELIDRHEALRTVIREDDRGAHQHIVARAEPALQRVAVDDGDAVDLQVAALAQAPFDLARGPLFRAHLLSAPEQDVLVLGMHHIISDGWSIDVLLTELAALYDGAELEAPALQYADYALWQRQWLGAGELEASLERWCDRLRGAPPLLTLPWDRPRPPVPTNATRTLPRRLSAELAAGLREVARREGLSFYQLGFALYGLLLSRYSGQDELVIGTVSANRSQVEVEGMVGYVAAPLPVRLSLTGSPTLAELLHRARAAVVDALGDQHVSIEHIVKAVNPERSLSYSPLFQVFYSLERDPDAAPTMGNIPVRRRDVPTEASPFDLSLHVSDRGDEIALGFEYCTDLFDAATIAGMADVFELLAEHLVAGASVPTDQLPLLGPAARENRIRGWNATSRPVEDARPVPLLVAERARERPEAVAVADSREVLRYGDLDRRANQVAHLLASFGLRRGEPVAICSGRSAAAVATIVGIAKAGAAYVPLDLGSPIARIGSMARSAGVRVCFAPAERVAELSGVIDVVLPLGQALDTPASPPPVTLCGDDLAYIIFTSGSTGTPKGVELVHAGLRNVVAYRHRAFAMTAADRNTLLNSLAFDIATLNLWATLSIGASLHIADDDTRLSPPALRDWLLEQGITIADTPAPITESLLCLSWPAKTPLRYLVTGGDRLRQRPPASLPFKLINEYGPTEATIDSTACEVDASGDGPPPIGRPIDNTAAYVLDAAMQPVPVGVVGELYIGGAGVARGYLGQPGATAARFVPDPFSPEGGRRLYRSGDQCRHLPDGSIHFVGRVDHQVKIRGFRIELGEIEAVLLGHERVSAAAVVARDEGARGKRLVAYVVAGEPAPSPDELRAHVAAHLAPYMVPADVVLLDAMPMAASGKLDRAALPAPPRAAELDQPALPPETDTERALHDIWCELLAVDSIGVEVDFFQAGGHSLLAMQLLARVSERLGRELSVRDVFSAPTIRALAARIDADRGGHRPRPRIEPVARDGVLLASFAQEQMWAASQLSARQDLYNVPVVLHVDGQLSVSRLERAVAQLLRRHEALRTSFRSEAGKLVQLITPPSVVVIDPQPVDDDLELRALVDTAAAAPFDLERGPLFRVHLYRNRERDVLLLTMHHIVCDRWSIEIILADLAALYGADEGEATPEPPAIQYADYAAWQRRWMQGEELERRLAAWSVRLQGAPAVLELPTDRPRPPVQSHEGAFRSRRLPTSLAAELRALARDQELSLYQLGFALCSLLLSRASGQDDLVIGTLSANRGHAGIERTVGYFVNPVPVRVDLSEAQSFADVLQRARAAALAALDVSDLPLEKIVSAVNPPRSSAYTPLFQVVYSFEHEPSEAPAFGGMGARASEPTTTYSKFDLSFTLTERGTDLVVGIEYSTALFDASTIDDFAARFESLASALVRGEALPARVTAAGRTRSSRATIPIADRKRRLPLSLSQEQMFARAGAAPQGWGDHLAAALRLGDDVDATALQRGLDELLRRHEALRTRIAVDADGPHQLISPPRRLGVEVEAIDDDSGLLRRLAEITRAPFALQGGPLFRARAFRQRGELTLLLVAHRLICDERSIELLATELGALCAGQALAAPERQLADFACWQRQRLLGGQLSALAKGCRQRLAGAPAQLTLPWDRPRAPVLGLSVGRRSRRLSADLVAALRGLAERTGTSLELLGLALSAVLLSRYSGQEDLVIGTLGPSSRHPELEGSVGSFDVPLPVRVDLSGPPSFATLLERAGCALGAALDQQELPIDALRAATCLELSSEQLPSLQVVYACSREPSGLGTARPELPPAPSELDLTIRLRERGESVELTLDYRDDLFTADTADRLCESFAILAHHVAAGSAAPITELPLLSGAALERVVSDWNQTSSPIDDPRPVPQLVTAWAEKHPYALAVEDPRGALSYGELERRANRIAHHLLSLGVGRGDRVLVWAGRSVATVATIVGVVKSGAAYLPLDTSTPLGRVKHIVGAAGVRLGFAAPERLADLAAVVEAALPVDAAIDAPDTPPAVTVHGDDLAYIIYTSGSTGVPKGVEIEHGGLRNAVAPHPPGGAPAGPGRHTFFSSISFDLASFDLWVALSRGSSLHIPDEDTRLSPKALRDWIVAHRITVAHAPTPLAELLLAETWPDDCALEHLMAAGDRLRVRPTPEQRFTLVNGYGPSECSMATTLWPVEPAAPGAPARPPVIGRPLGNVTIYILDDRMQPVPPGVVGELYIGGAGVGRGYLDQPALTAERFVPDPFASQPGRRLYRSGDLSRYLPDGTIDFLGRRDHQIKIRGFRIELGEIEAVLSQHESVREVAVVARDEGAGKRLVAYVVPRQLAPSAGELSEHAAALLPPYMVPDDVVLLEAMPVTSNGKIDRKALPAPTRTALHRNGDAPRSDAEAILRDIWQSLLQVPEVGVRDNFFELGGNSLLAIQLAAQVSERLGVELAVSQIFEHPTIDELTPHLTHGAGDIARATRLQPIPPRPDRNSHPLTTSQRMAWSFHTRGAPSSFDHPAMLETIEGPLDLDVLEDALRQVVRRHAPLRSRFIERDGAVVQLVDDSSDFHLERVDLLAARPGDSVAQRRERALALVAERDATFDLERGPLLRSLLVRVEADEYALFNVIHHSVFDGFSAPPFTDELWRFYARARGEAVDPPEPLPCELADVAAWQRDFLNGPGGAEQIAYWREQLAGCPPLCLPTTGARQPEPPLPGYRPRPGASTPGTVPQPLAEAARALAEHAGVSPYMLHLAALSVLLARRSGQDDFCLFSPYSHRDRPETTRLIGYLANPLLMRMELDGAPSFVELLQRARHTVLGAFDHPDLPLGWGKTVHPDLPVDAPIAAPELYRVAFNYTPQGAAGYLPSALRARPLALAPQETRFEQVWFFAEGAAGIRFFLHADASLFSADETRALVAAYLDTLSELLADPQRPLPLG